MAEPPANFQDNSALEALFSDAADARRLLRENDTDFNRRGYVRTVYAGIEALTNWLRQQLLEMHQHQPVPTWSSADIAMLKEESYYLDSNGIARSQIKFSSIDSSLRFVVQLTKHFPRQTFQVDWTSSSWLDLVRGLKVRHRLTHPRTRSDLTVTDEEIRTVKAAHSLAVEIFFQPLHAHVLERNAKRSN